MWWLAIGSVTFLGVLGALVPRLSRRTVPLGVDVPSAYAEHPVVREAIGRYRLGVAWLTLAVLLAVGLGAYLGLSQAVASSVTLIAVVVMILGVTLVMRAASTPIGAAKREQDWYGGVPVAIVASVTGEPDPAGRVRWAWHAAALLGVVGLGVYALSRYGWFADPMVTHSSWSGPDQWAPKSWPVVLTPLGIGLGMVLAVAVVAALVARQTPRILPGGDIATARADSSRRVALSQHLVGAVNLLSAVTLGGLGLARWHGVAAAERPLLIASILAPVLLVAVTLVGLAGQRQRPMATGSTAGPVAGPAGGPAAGPESPDQDARWKLGAFYYAPDDPRFMVEKRMGVGLTVNFAHPAGKVFAVVTAVLLLVGVVGPLVAG